MINIVDARMGSGKTSAAINYMNSHPDKRYLFITPFIRETERIKTSCDGLAFWTPSNHIVEFGFRKSGHLKSLVRSGHNIALTHALFQAIDEETIALITERKYIIFIDEVIDIFFPLEISASDMALIIDSGWLVGDGHGEQSDYEYLETAAGKKYQGGKFSDLFITAKSHRLINIGEVGKEKQFYFWSLHKELFQLSDEVYVLTYMFDGMPMKAFLEMNQVEYKYMGVECVDGVYRFTETPPPDLAPELRDKIHICADNRLNEIGDRDSALSVNWTRSAMIHPEDGRIDRLRRNVNTYFVNHVPKTIKSDGRLWCTFKDAIGAVRGKGFYNSHLAWTARASNDYRDKRALAYCVNLYLNPNIQRYFALNGVSIDPEKYALANMVQWLWRGCIRDGMEMWVYIPSRRMRGLLMRWLDDLAGGAGEAHE